MCVQRLGYSRTFVYGYLDAYVFGEYALVPLVKCSLECCWFCFVLLIFLWFDLGELKSRWMLKECDLSVDCLGHGVT